MESVITRLEDIVQKWKSDIDNNEKRIIENSTEITNLSSRSHIEEKLVSIFHTIGGTPKEKSLNKYFSYA